MKIMVVTDHSGHETGYSRVGRSLMRRLALDGHEVFCYGPGGFSHGSFVYHDEVSGMKWLTMGSCFGDDRGGSDGYPYWVEYVQPDLIITMLDPCVLDVYGLGLTPTIMWAPIDTWPVNAQECGILGRAEQVIVPSRWGVDTLIASGINCKYVPYGIEPDELYVDYDDRNKFRDMLGINDETYLIGMVGVHYKNIPDRKGYAFAFEAIARFVANHPNEDIKAYVKTELKTEEGFLDLKGVRDTMQLQGVLGFSRPMGPRYDTNDELRQMLNGFDVLFNSSLTEGFCLPVLEAEACGTPVVANYATATAELIGPYGVGCNPAMSIIGPDGTQCALPSVDTLLEGLEIAYQEWKNKLTSRELISKWAFDNYNWNNLYETYWKDVLNNIPEQVSFIGLEPRLVQGCGMKPKQNATNHDLTLHHDFVDVAHDLNKFPYPWEDNQFNMIECEDVLEHLSCGTIDYMDECWRILRHGGYLEILTVENGSWQHLTDPTHERGFTLNSLDYFDDKTMLGSEYGKSYTLKRWNIVKKCMTPSGELLFILSPIKELE